MKTFVALLRGINVSGQKIIPMRELRDALNLTGLDNVRTYIQSGNVIFSSEEKSRKKLANLIQETIKQRFGHEVPVLVIEPETIVCFLDQCPFDQAKKEKSYFTFLYDQPDQEAIDKIESISYPNEELVIMGAFIYFYCSTGYGRAKWNNRIIERTLHTNATSRNFRTMTKLLSLCNQNP